MGWGNFFGLLFATAFFSLIACLVIPILFVVRISGTVLHWLQRFFSKPVIPPRSTDVTEEDLNNSAPIMFFIHGTWAPGAAWTQPSAQLSTAISARLKGLGVAPISHRIEWSGENTVTARLSAIAELHGRLKQVFERNPNRYVFLIAHSHGGNIAIKAIEPFSQNPGLGLVTLATPFLIAQGRSFPWLFRIGVPLAGYLGFLVVCLTMAFSGIVPKWTLLLVAVTAALLAIRSLKQRLSGEDIATVRLLESMPDLTRVGTLASKSIVISRSGDEADGILKLASFVNSWIANCIRNSLLFRHVSEIIAAGTKTLNIDPNTANPVAPPGTPRDWMNQLALSPRIWIAVWRYVWNIRDVGIELIAVLAGIISLKLLQVAVGSESGIVATTVMVTSSETPPGAWQHVQTLASPDPVGTTLSHSQIYDDPETQSIVANWIAARLTDCNRK